MQPLDPLQLPLRGQILIEASAGTGKTYTLALLVLRLLLERELSIDQILVVTFTRAATEELRGRIRLRLREALDLVEGGICDDPTLRQMIAAIVGQEPARKQRIAILLRDSLARMDEAAIHTIHGFCQRMLQEHAFVSGSPFAMDFIEDENRLRRQIIADFWRLHFYDTPRKAAWASASWQTPDGLLKALGPHLNREDLICLPRIDEQEHANLEQQVNTLFPRLQTLWLAEREAVRSLLLEHKGLKRARTTGYHPDRVQQGFAELDTWLQSRQPPWLMPKLASLFTTSTVRSLLKKTCREAPAHPFLDLFDQFHESHARLDRNRKILLVLAARRYMTTELDTRKEKKGQLSFDDLLRRMADALHEGGGLVRLIQRRFPAILVDEFQDTDPLQYRIFAAVHRAGRKNALFLIGDPKQAIYGFRGADIFTYLKARHDTRPELHFTMTTNYRSASSMVAAVNRIFRRQNPFVLTGDTIPFIPMRPRPDADRDIFLRHGAPWPPLACLLLDEQENLKPWSKDRAMELAAELCARQTAVLLAEGETGQASIGERGLAGGDIAILVRTHREASAMRKALRRHRIASVYASRDSVFASPEAEQVHILLACLHNPTDPDLIRSLLVTDLFGYTANMLDELREQEWERLAAEISDYARLYRQEGVLVMLYALLAARRVVGRLLAHADGERILTNFTHLVELLEKASRDHTGEDALLRVLADSIRDPDAENEAAQLRLESDERLVRIVTIHKAKGLEYPLVFLPFLWAARPVQKKEPFSFHDPDLDQALCLDLGSGEARRLVQAEQERLAEDLRLVYVSITRARYGCFFCWGRVRSMEQSALSYLLHEQIPASRDQLIADLDRLAGQDWQCRILRPQELHAAAGKPTTGQAKQQALHSFAFTGVIDDTWRITSYSNLVRGHETRPEQPDYDRFTVETPPGQPGRNRFGFPRGAAAGTCLHAILEHIPFTDPATHGEIISRQLAKAGFSESWAGVVEKWLADVLSTEIVPGFNLAMLDKSDRLNEVAFSYPLLPLDRQAFNRILTRHGLAPLPGDDKILQGLLVGYIDLVFRHQGRYCIADYKSNHLGDLPADYGPDRLMEAMLVHRYDLQYLFYTLALHRFLQSRLDDYAYETHIGPICYLFLRGMNPEAPGSGVFLDQPAPELIAALDACIQGKAP